MNECSGPARKRSKSKPTRPSPTPSGAWVARAGFAAVLARECAALFVVNHSGGKDSDAMLERLVAIIPKRQLLVVHACLGRVEWEGALEHARDHAASHGLPFVVAYARRSLLEMVRDRFANRPEVPSWPSKGQRQCTSDLKRGPIEREVRRYASARGIKFIVNCMGLRAEESHDREDARRFTRNKLQSKAGRRWYNWLPIHHMTEVEVFAQIAASGRTPHPAYAAGNERLSCKFCILGSMRDARNGALHDPDLFAEYVELERTTGYTVHQGRKSLEEFAGLTVESARAGRRHLPVV